MRAMILKEFLELRRDRRTVAMLVVLPLMLLVVFGYAASFNVSRLVTDVAGPAAQEAAARLPPPFDVERIEPSKGEAYARERLRDNRADVVVVTAADGPAVAYIDGSSLFAAQQAVASLARAGGAVRPEILYNPDLKTSWVMVPPLVGLILTFIGTIVTSIGLVRERQTGTLEQLAVMPFRPVDVIVGKIAPYFLLAALDMVLVTIIGCLLFGVPFAGNAALFAVGGAVFLFAVLGVGVLVSTVSASQGQAVQLAMMVMLPQILLSGMIFPIEAMAAGVRWIAYILPLTYFNQIAQGVMLRAAPLSALWGALLLLTVIAAVVFTLAVLSFRRTLTPRQRNVRRRRHTPAEAPAGSADAAGR